MGSTVSISGYMASCATPVIDVWCFRCITCVEIQVYYMCSRYTCNINVLNTCEGYIPVLHM